MKTCVILKQYVPKSKVEEGESFGWLDCNIPGKFHGIFQYADMNDGGGEAYPVAIVELSDGTLKEVFPHHIKMDKD